MKICTWNVNSINVRLGHVLDWLQQHQPDVMCLQETKMVDERFPVDAFEEMQYAVRYSGQKTYNGVAVAATGQLDDPLTDIPSETFEDPQRRLLAVTHNDVRVLNVYVPNGSEVGSEKYQYKLNWLTDFHRYVKQEVQRYENLIILGDFNIAPADADVHDPDLWRDKILCSVPEREMLERLLDCGLVDVFRNFEQPEDMFSWWDYRAAAFRRNMGLRIDLILASQNLADRCTSCVVDKAPRKLQRPSDHAPVVAEFDLD